MDLRELKESIFHMWPAKVISLGAAVLFYVFVNIFSLSKYEILVPIQYVLPDGMVQASEHITKANLVFRAEPAVIVDLKSKNLGASDFLVEVDLSDVQKTGPYRGNLKVSLLTGGKSLQAYGFERIEPGLALGSLEKAYEKEVLVIPRFQGQPPLGFELGDFALSPEKIRIEGPELRLKKLGSIETEAIVLDNHDQSFVGRVRTKIPDPLVRAVETELVTVKITIRSGLQVVVFNSIPIESIGLQKGYKLSTTLPNGTIRLRQALITSAESNDKIKAPRLFVDLAEIKTPGVYSLPVLPLGSTGVDILEISPPNIELEIKASTEVDTVEDAQ